MSYLYCSRKQVEANTDFRRVVFTADHIQVVLMSVPAGEEIGEEIHEEHDQTFTVVAGQGKMLLGKEEVALSPGDVVVVPKGVYHNLKSLGPNDLKLYSFCSPPHHPVDTVHPDRQSALGAREH